MFQLDRIHFFSFGKHACLVGQKTCFDCTYTTGFLKCPLTNIQYMWVLGNVVISKKILCTRKILVMHSNERGECCISTLIDRKRKRYDNAVDVVVCLQNPTDPSTERMAPPSSAHVQLDDVPWTSIQQSFTGEFRQHNGLVTVMMLLPTQGFA